MSLKPQNFMLLIALLLVSCATYQTPGAGVNVGNLSKADTDIAEIMKREPASPFPARIAAARVQSSGYYSHGNQCYGKGSYCVVTKRDVETEQDFGRISALPMVSGIAAMSRILLPDTLTSIKDLRVAAATLKADMLLVYSLDTRFNVESTDIGPLALISLGFFPNKEAHVSTTASAVLFDVRTGFVYGAVESTAAEQQRATVWSSTSAIDNARLKTEKESFQKMLGEFEKLWKGIVESNARTNEG